MNRVASIELGDYQLEERIGEGGSGQVYRARGPAGVVAVKVLGPSSDLDDAARARFHREIAALGQIDHPNLVKMIAHGIDAELGPYLVLPLLAGTSLRSLCSGRLCPEAALLLIQPVVQATAALHARGYVHRDLKPENAIAAPDGTITVIDLGLAWREGMTRHTDTGAAVGSVGYMAPEQIEGRPVETSADVWALGVMLYELVAGKRPFARPRPAEEAAAALLGVCPKLAAADRRASEELSLVIARCLDLDPAKRPTAAELGVALDGMVDWCDDAATERATVVADPIGYQARVAPFRVRRAERLAREAMASPFVALAHCDRGLAYAPDDASLLALVASAEAGSGARAAAPVPGSAKRVWPWIAGAVLVVTAVAVVAKLSVTPSDPWAGGSTSTTAAPVASAPLIPDEGDRKMVGNFVSVFGRAMNRRDGTATPSSDQALAHDMVDLFGTALSRGAGIDVTPDPHAGERIPTTAAGWLQRASREEPADALASVRHALELDPKSYDAQLALCIMLEGNHDAAEAITACNTVLAKHPDESYALTARGRAFSETGDHAAAKRDLDAACKAGKKSACTATP